MKKFLLFVLVMVFLVSAFLVGVFLYKNGGDRRFAAEKGEEIKINNEKLTRQQSLHSSLGGQEIKDDKIKEYLLTSGPVKKNLNGQAVVTSVNGRFVRFEDIAESEDKYLVLDGVETPYNKLRVVAKPDKTKNRPYPTQVNVLLSRKTGSINSRLRQVGDFGDLRADWISFYFTSGVWLKGILYKNDTESVLDENGVYVLRAINVSEIRQ